MKYKWVILAGVLAVGVGVWLWSPWSSPNQSAAPTKRTSPTKIIPKVTKGISPTKPMPAQIEPELDGPSVDVLGTNGQGTAASLVIGAGGMYPSIAVEIDPDGRGTLPKLEVATLAGQAVETLEVYARSTDVNRPGAFWGEVKPVPSLPSGEDDESAYEIKLQPSIPMRFQIKNSAGEPVPNTRVVLSRRALHVMRLDATSDMQGFVQFNAIPTGEYHATVYAPGYLRQDVSLLSHQVGADLEQLHQVTVQPSREIYGCIKDTNGQGAANALVFAHVVAPSHPWFDRTLYSHEVVRVDGPPVEGMAQADINGCFSITGLSAGQVYLEARTAMDQPTVSPPYDLVSTTELGPIEFSMIRGHDVVVRVQDAAGEHVPSATVSWRDGLTGLSGSAVSDEKGLVIFAGLPPTAVVQAKLKSWTSAQYALGLPDEQGDYELAVVLESPANLKRWTLRLFEPKNMELDAVFVVIGENGKQIRCEAVGINERDWLFDACPQGDGWLHVRTRHHGTWMLGSTFGEDMEKTMPEPKPVTVTLTGLTPLQARSVVLSWRPLAGFDWQEVMSLKKTKQPVTVTWQGRLYPESYRLKAKVESLSFGEALVVKPGQSTSKSWSITPPVNVSVHVVDVRGVPVRGAFIRWIDKNSGKRLKRATSAGHTPSVFQLKPGSKRMVLVTSPKQGEGQVTLDVAPDMAPSLRVTLNKKVLEVAYPTRITSISLIEELLGASLVEDGDALLVDVTRRDSAAFKAGIPRGATLLDVTRRGKRTTVVVEHNGKRLTKTLL